MAFPWDDLNARAAGLGTHLLEPAERRRLAGSPDLAGLVRALPPALRPPPGTPPSARGLDRAVGRAVGRRLAVLERWAGERRPALAGVLEAEERRAVRALLRGAATGAPRDLRLDGLTPTAGLPPRLQERAAAANDVGELASILERAGNPYGPPLAAAPGASSPPEGERTGAGELFRLEMALARAFADRAVAGARRAGAAYRRFVAESVDLENAWTVLAAPSGGGEETPRFLEGGLLLDEERFRSLRELADREERRRGLARALAATPAGRALEGGGGEAALERSVLAERRRAARDEARRDPLGPAPFLHFVLRLREEASDLRRIAWGLALDAPVERRVPGGP